MAQPTGELTVWIDKRSFLPLKMEVRDTYGVVADRSEVSQVDYDVPMPYAKFTYNPPAGVQVATFRG